MRGRSVPARSGEASGSVVERKSLNSSREACRRRRRWSWIERRAYIGSIPDKHRSPRGVRIEPNRVAHRARDAARQGQGLGLVVDRCDAEVVRDRRDRDAVGVNAWDAVAILEESGVIYD